MSESAKAVSVVFLILSAIASVFIWAGAGIPSTPIVWGLRVGLPALTVVTIIVLALAPRRKDIAPDFLRRLLGKPFEKDGVCFSILPTSKDGTAYLNIVFQNRYASPCTFHFVIYPREAPFSIELDEQEFAGIAMEIECQGGVFGVARTPIGVPTGFQGVRTRYNIAAKTHYPDGKGLPLRFRRGSPVADPGAYGRAFAAVAVTVAASLAHGHISLHSRLTWVTLTLPKSVAEDSPSTQVTEINVLWRPDEPVYGVDDKLSESLAN